MGEGEVAGKGRVHGARDGASMHACMDVCGKGPDQDG